MSFFAEIYNPIPARLIPDTKKIAEALQNATLDSLDLLVRETVQNSLDAAVDDDSDLDVRVNFIHGDFDSDVFASYLGERFASGLNRFLAAQKIPNKFLAVRDQNCVGLTGSPNDKSGNLYKLIYGFLDGKGDGADEGTAGGSYGVGKTVYLRFGIGFVAYYSRTKDGKSKLALFYCKNSNSNSIYDNNLLPHQLAWWGKQGEVPGASEPVEDEDTIADFLKVFGVKPYGRKESGTTVIVPFFAGMPPRSDNSAGAFRPWENSIDDYLRFCVMKWYAPRYRGDLKMIWLNNQEAPFRSCKWGRYLGCVFSDNKPLSQSSISIPEHKIFSLIRDMYDMAVGTLPLRDGVTRNEIERNNAPQNNIYLKTKKIGYFVTAKINYVDGEYENTLPVLNALSSGQNVQDRKGFVLYCRMPGMIMTYDESWDRVLSNAKVDSGEFIISLFVVNSDNMVYSDPGRYEEPYPLDQLFRETEKSDHNEWPVDAKSHGLPLIHNVVYKLRGIVSELYPKNQLSGVTESRGDFSRGLGHVFMAGRTGFGGTQLFPEGNGGVDPDNPEPTTPGPSRKKTRIVFGDEEFDSSGCGVRITLPVKINAIKSDSVIGFAIAVDVDGVPAPSNKWNKADGEFPIKISACDFPEEVAGKKIQTVVDDEGVACKIDLSQVCGTEISGRICYEVNRGDMATVVIRSKV